ncbi:MAG: GGDEF domain-containing protein [Caldilineaceae bacterium]
MALCNRICIGGVVALAFLIATTIMTSVVPVLGHLVILLVLATLAVIAQFFGVRSADGQAHYPHNVFFFAGVLLLPPFLLVPLFAIPLWIEMVQLSRMEEEGTVRWNDLLLNIALYTVTGSCAHWLYFTLNNYLVTMVDVGQVFAALASVLVYVIGNHFCFRLADILINKLSWQESAAWLVENLWAEFVMAYLGYIVAVLWFVNPVMILPMLGVLVLIQKALLIPRLQQEAQTDSKTGLLNVRYFNQRLEDALERAHRLGRPLSLIMADLDFLRRINNNYGHLAGDMVLIGVSHLLHHAARPEDSVARFGGEEFALLLPDTTQEEAVELAEAMRVAIERSAFEVPTSSKPISTTMTFGVASFPQDALTATDLLHQADVAVYQAKIDGRNRTVCANDLFYRIKGDDENGIGHDTHGDAGKPLPTVRHPLAIRPLVENEEGVILGDSSALFKLLSVASSHGGITTLAVVVTLLSLIWRLPTEWATIFWLMILAAGAQFLRVRLFSSGELSVSASVLFAAALLAGVPGVAVVSAVITVTSLYAERRAEWRSAFNQTIAYHWAMGVMAAFVPALIMSIMALPLDLRYVLLFCIPFAMMATAYSYIGVGLMALDVSMTLQKSFAQVWQEDFEGATRQYLLMAFIGLCFGIAYTMFGWGGMFLCALPIYVMRLAQEQFVAHESNWLGNFCLPQQEMLPSPARTKQL